MSSTYNSSRSVPIQAKSWRLNGGTCQAKPQDDIKFKVAATVAAFANRVHSSASVVETCVSFGLLIYQNLTFEMAELWRC